MHDLIQGTLLRTRIWIDVRQDLKGNVEGPPDTYQCRFVIARGKRFFGGLDIPETAAMLEVSEATILRDWRAAKAWLARDLHRKR
jgi:hypothetical protein